MNDAQSQVAPPEIEWPQNEDAEEACIAILLGRPELYPHIAHLRAEDFYWATWSSVWTGAQLMIEKGRAPSALTIGGVLRAVRRERGEPDNGIGEVLNTLAINAPRDPAYARAAADEVKSLAERRRLMHLHMAAFNDAQEVLPSDTTEELVTTAMTALQGVIPPRREKSTIKDSVAAVMARASNRAKADEEAIWFGVKELDERIGGMRPGNFVVIAGRPGGGKSLLATRAIRTVAEAGFGVLAFELEMSAEETTARMMCDLARDKGVSVWYSSVQRGSVLPSNRSFLAEAGAEIEDWPLYIDERPGLKLEDLRQAARQVKRSFEEKGQRLALIVVDHIGLVTASTDRRGNKVAEMTDVSNAMKAMAKELNCVVIGVSQLSRAVEGRDDKRPVLSDLRESGSIEQDADTVMLIYREAYYLKQRQATMAAADYAIQMRACEHNLEVNTAKLRSGDPGVDMVDIDAATGSIRERGRFS